MTEMHAGFHQFYDTYVGQMALLWLHPADARDIPPVRAGLWFIVILPQTRPGRFKGAAFYAASAPLQVEKRPRFRQGQRLVKLVKFFVALLILPAAIGLTLTGWEVARRGVAVAVTAGSGLAFAAGYALWLVVFALLPKPMRTYVLGHELTHALWAWCLGARVGGLKVRKSGGEVRTSKTNWAIVLAPYFFPFYAMLFIILFFVAHLIWGLDRWMWVLFFLVGLGWSFHVSFTAMMLLTTSQPDLKSQGLFFSLVVIYSMNLLTILVTAALLSRAVDFLWLGQTLVHDVWTTYGWTLDKVLRLWHRLAA